MDNKQFLKKLATDCTLKSELQAFLSEKQVQNEEEKYAAIIDFAAEKGCTITVEDISLFLAGCRKMDAEELEHVAGGWCFFSDDCSSVISYHPWRDECSTTYRYNEICSWDDHCIGSTNHYS